MKKLLYNDYVRRLSEKMTRRFDEIAAVNNYEFGSELEVALCQILSECLPQKYGVCRGYVVDANGNQCGDDIQVFAQDRFFTLRSGLGRDFNVKEQIPIEAAISYIEAKHTLCLEGEGSSSLFKAWAQVENVKRLCAQRDSLKIGSWNPYLECPVEFPLPKGFTIQNPMHGVIFARNISLKENSKKKLSPDEINAIIQRRIPEIASISNKSYWPDLIIAGDSIVVTPSIFEAGEMFFNPFVSNDTDYGTRVVPGLAYGIGFTCLQFVLDWIRLGKLPFDRILADALDISRIEGGPGGPCKNPGNS